MVHQELFHRHAANPILTVRDWPYPAHTVFNAGACLMGDETVLLVRVEDRRGHSHLSVARSHDGVSNWQIDSRPSFAPSLEDYSEEAWGVEDPRVTWVNDRARWVIAYTAYSTSGPLVSLAETKDFSSFSRFGPVMPPENKDAAVFPCRFGNRYAMIHRPVSTGKSAAHLWLSFSPDLIHWGDHRVLFQARRGAWWDANKIGLGPPPLETPEGWLILYHGVR
ncbi:MAG: glycoside hydrolase family 130 protein, partial [Thermoguttaceae bacterium]